MAYPVHMIVITPENYISALQPWINRKIQKGFDVNVVTTAQAGSNYNAIQSYVQNLYNTGVSQGATPTFLVLVGDTGQIPGRTSGTATQKVTDLYYGSVDNDYFPDMFYSRMSAENTNQVTAIVNKILQYEQYTMPDPSYLNNVTLIAGWDSYWNARIGRPTINYATTYYYNTAHGFNQVNTYLQQGQYTGCYNTLNTGVGFINYTAHGSETSWSDPQYTNSNVDQLTNTNKYFLAMGICSLSGNFDYSSACFGEAMIRAENKAAYSYIGSCPVTYWYEDYYFGVGATTVMNQTPTQQNTATGVYDGIWMDETYNTVSSITFLGNIAVCYAHAGNYQTSTTPLYYWQAYHVLGDGSIMPYRVQPTPNNVSHANTFPSCATTFQVSAQEGSYVAISQNNELKGVALVPASGSVNVPVTACITSGQVRIVVTKPQRQPYIQDINVGGGTQTYTVSVSANPAICGTVTGGGTYCQGQSCTLSATPNANYIFLNWTENGEVVSTNVNYSFTVAGDRDLVANFDALTNYWEPESNEFEDNMTLTCIVQLDGVEQATSMLEVGAFCGTQCRGSQRATYFAPSDHYIFQMIVFGESNDVISFRLYDHLTEQELLLIPPTPITFNSNGYGSLFNPYVLNFTSNVLISAEASPAGAGTITGAGEYPIGTEVTLTAVANTGYQFVNWMLDGEVVSTSPSYQFTVTEAADFVANFGCVHTQALNSGWNWWSTYIELNNNDGLIQLENSIGGAGIIIKSRTNGYVEAYQYNGETNWYGTLSSINNEQMYKIRTNAACNATIAGMATMPSNHPISIKNGWNWIGFPCNQNVSVDVALSGFTPEANDVIKGRNGFTTYYSDENYSMWYGTLNTLEPGRGYMYRSNSTTQKTLVFQMGRGETTMENVTTENNNFQPTDSDFADNMTITAVLELDGEELSSDDYELAAFVGDECRGSVRLMYVEPVNRYVAFLTVFGEPSETLYFRLTDGTQTELSMDEITFAADGMEGTLSEPMTLRFGTTKLDENEWSKVLVYPNPSNGVFNIQGQGIRKIEVFNAFGQAVVSEETNSDHLQIDLSRYADGCYMLRVVTDNGISNRQLIKR